MRAPSAGSEHCQSAAALVKSPSVHLRRTTLAFLLTNRPNELNPGLAIDGRMLSIV